ncbi:uncharacterized protein LOC128883801 isoform X2 [Hylaeus volcanicus]|uniref:uncharacterized protein LOC128883801 isoform X2 n=1 Tax=Hylaeus volcanicus TaxID=313075 RepID=UPI0023B79579|nr:uncharacterized protein LOC128883801 isoform X2 [Hylaeus volcanicus]
MEVVTTPSAYEFACAVINDSTHPCVTHASVESVINKSNQNKKFKGKSIDYSKWDILAKKLEEEEEQEENKKTKENIDKQNFKDFIGGCSSDKTERQIYEKPTAEKLLAAKRFREEGNMAFLKKDYTSSAIQYQKALLHFYYTFPDTEKEEACFNKEKLACHLNLAQCKIKLKDWEEALTQCRLALQIDPDNAKGFYRRGLAYFFLDDFEKAEEAFKSALSKSPFNVEISVALKKLQIKRNEYTKKEKKMSAKIIKGLKTKCNQDVLVNIETKGFSKENIVAMRRSEPEDHKQEEVIKDQEKDVDFRTKCDYGSTTCGVYNQSENITKKEEKNVIQEETGHYDSCIKEKQLFWNATYDTKSFLQDTKKDYQKKTLSETSALNPAEIVYSDSLSPKKISDSSYPKFFNWYPMHLCSLFTLIPAFGISILGLLYVVLFPLSLLLIHILIKHFG